MTKMLKLPVLLFLFIGITVTTIAQSDKKKPYTITADSLSTGNYKDVFKSFFQLAFDRFTSKNKDLQFTSNPFAIMARANPNLLIDTNYTKYTALRNLNFSFSAKLDSSYKFNGFSSGITYAIINRRDVTISQYFLTEVSKANNEAGALLSSLGLYVSTITDREKQNKFSTQITNFFKDSTARFDSLDKELQQVIKDSAKAIGTVHLLEVINKNPKASLRTYIKQNYDSVKNDFQNRLLWTASISDTTYKDEFMFSNVVLSTNLLKGITNREKAQNRRCEFELNLKAAYQFLDDTLTTGRDLKRQAFTFEPGLNLVLKNRRTQHSWAEFKLSGGYTHLNKPYASERKDSITVNGTLRIRVFDDIWIPLEIKYDPKSGNVFGFLNVRANFTTLGSAFNKKPSSSSNSQ
ncbi:hypothetical protein HB364_10455 [Pseudoflavitalea sp. X16]|uniref:hypothetical protein n=1 Tax=Paraflavitalea devenefica TaxID=2716334 RepID=UPI00141F736F|nr:hypothetical protein [Paraflavitalea devenefica]NII25505.1 hypothetical protein [Paraflavitalea devenefica]